MKFPDDEIRYELPNSLRAHINKPSDIATDVTQSDSPGEQVAYNPYRDNDLDMTVPLDHNTFCCSEQGQPGDHCRTRS